MNFNYDTKIIFDKNDNFDINAILNVCKKYPGKKFLIEVPNTRGITSFQLRQLAHLKDYIKIRIAGGYDEEKIKHLGMVKYGNGETGEYYTTAVIYDISESVIILETIEDIEKRIQSNWSDLEKVVYIYNKLKSLLMYDPKYEKKQSKEIRSLRGLITKETVCAGFSLIFKELMDRQKIPCEYVQGISIVYKLEGNKKKEDTGGHAWNIVTIDGKKYGIDLTWENGKFRAGIKNSFDYFGKGIQDFAKRHIPDSWERTQNYEQTLSTFDEKTIKIINAFLLREETYDKMKFTATRQDGSKFIIAQVGNEKYPDGITYYRYYYQEILPNGLKANPHILYSNSNLANFINARTWGETTPDNYENTFVNVLFSKRNIAESISCGTLYIGYCGKRKVNGDYELVRNVDEIIKPSNLMKMFPRKSKVFRRGDRTVFIAEKIPSQNVVVNGQTILCFHIFEYLQEEKNFKVKRNIVFTERDFFDDNRLGIADDYLSRSRLDRKLAETGGYIGYYSSDGIRTYNPSLVSYFKTPRYTNTSLTNNTVENGFMR